MKEFKLKKNVKICFILIALIIIIIFIINLFKVKSYSLEYNIEDYEISENYDNNDLFYYYEIKYNNLVYSFVYEHDYLKEKKLISNVKAYENDDYTCLLIDSSYLSTYPLCSHKENLIDYHLIPEELKEEFKSYYKEEDNEETEYNNYRLYNSDNDLFIWAYKGFNYIRGKDVERIELFKKDIYDISLATRINNYILVPDYEQEYNFNKVYLINTESLEIEEWALKYDISFDSYILGTHDKSIFLVDRKNKIEYELVPHKQKMRIVGTKHKNGILYKNNKEQSISLNKLSSDNQHFVYKSFYEYSVEDNNLYLNYINSDLKIKVSNQKISSIIHSNKDKVYYLVKDTLYKYSLKDGEEKVMTYTEWQFNYNNMIFVNN